MLAITARPITSWPLLGRDRPDVENGQEFLALLCFSLGGLLTSGCILMMFWGTPLPV